MRWFAVPTINDAPDAAPITDEIPKYSDQVSEWAGIRMTYDGQDWFLARYDASTATLDSIESNDDAHTLDSLGVTESEAAQFINDVTGQTHTWTEWTDIWTDA